jgi:Na+/H+-dicarboxylate symporter
MAVPPVSGGALVCMGVLFTQLGIPTSALALAATLNIFLDFVCTGTKIAMIELELTQQAGILGMIDYDVLRK